MSSSVFYKFKSQKEPTRVEFDGTTITVFELKREIILKSGLGDGTDFDLAIYTEDGEGKDPNSPSSHRVMNRTNSILTEYDDDTALIPRSTTVVARRLPAPKPGHGRAARYVSGKMPIHAKNSKRQEPAAKAQAKSTTNAILPQLGTAMTADEEADAFFQMQSANWAAQNEEMASKTAVWKPGGKKPVNVPDHDPPPGYICYRCGEKGHWIQLCPTNDNPDYDNRPRVKRTTGIPKSFLRTVDKATALSQLGATSEDDIKTLPGVMVNADGDFVIAEPDKASWEQFQAKSKSSATAAKAASEDAKELEEKGLLCSIDKKMFIEPMKTPCCGKTYCNECITNALIESDFVCPNCGTEGVLIDDLKPDEEAQSKIKWFIEEKAAAKEEKLRSPSPAAAKSSEAVKEEGATTDSKVEAEPDEKEKTHADLKSSTQSPEAARSVSPAAKEEAADSPADKATPSADPAAEDEKSRKRPAEVAAENPKAPKGPKAMQTPAQQQSNTQQQQQAAMMNQMMNGINGMSGMNGMNGMPPMPSIGGFGGMPIMPPFPGMAMPPMNMPGMLPNMPNMPNMNMNMGMGMPPMGWNGGMPMNPGMMNPNMMNPMMGMPGFNPNMGGNGNGNGNFNNSNNGGGAPQWGNGQNRHDEDSPYFRKPVNPHRQQKRRTRPMDFRELGS
jgi:protein MPE1